MVSDTPESERPLEPTFAGAFARALRPQPWLKVHLPLFLPDIDKTPRKRLPLDMGDGRTVELFVRPDNLAYHICHFDQIETLLAPEKAEAGPVAPLADELLRLSRDDVV